MIMLYVATYIVLHSWQFLYPMVYDPLWILRNWIKMMMMMMMMTTTTAAAAAAATTTAT